MNESTGTYTDHSLLHSQCEDESSDGLVISICYCAFIHILTYLIPTLFLSFFHHSYIMSKILLLLVLLIYTGPLSTAGTQGIDG